MLLFNKLIVIVIEVGFEMSFVIYRLVEWAPIDRFISILNFVLRAKNFTSNPSVEFGSG